MDMIEENTSVDHNLVGRHKQGVSFYVFEVIDDQKTNTSR